MNSAPTTPHVVHDSVTRPVWVYKASEQAVAAVGGGGGDRGGGGSRYQREGIVIPLEQRV